MDAGSIWVQKETCIFPFLGSNSSSAIISRRTICANKWKYNLILQVGIPRFILMIIFPIMYKMQRCKKKHRKKTWKKIFLMNMTWHKLQLWQELIDIQQKEGYFPSMTTISKSSYWVILLPASKYWSKRKRWWRYASMFSHNKLVHCR